MLSKVLFMVSPSGSTRPRTLVNAENGAVIQGNANDVTVLQAQGKLNDLSLAANESISPLGSNEYLIIKTFFGTSNLGIGAGQESIIYSS